MDGFANIRRDLALLGTRVRAFQQTCEQEVCRFDGVVVQCNEQGLLACFGYPVAHEDAAGRAVRAGLEILEHMAALGARLRREPWAMLCDPYGVFRAPQGRVRLRQRRERPDSPRRHLEFEHSRR